MSTLLSPGQTAQSQTANLQPLDTSSQVASPSSQTTDFRIDPDPQAVFTLYDASIITLTLAFGLTLDILALLRAHRHPIVLFIQAFFVYGFTGLYTLGLQKRVRPPVVSWYFHENACDGLRHLGTLITVSGLLSTLGTLSITIVQKIIQPNSSRAVLSLIVVLAAGTMFNAATKVAERDGLGVLSDNARQRVRTTYSHSLAAIVAGFVVLFLTKG